MPGLKPMFRNSLSAEGAKAVTIKAWAPKARMLMPNSGRFVRLCVRLTILNLLKVYMNLYLRFLHFKFFKVLKQIMYLWIKWIMERCYPSVTNSSDGLIFVKRRAKDGRFFSKNTGVRRAKRRAKFKLCIKKARKFDSRHFNNKSA